MKNKMNLRTKRTITFRDLQKVREEIKHLLPSLPIAIPKPSFVIKFPVGMPIGNRAKVENTKQPEIKYDFFGFESDLFDVDETHPVPKLKENINQNWRHYDR